jgi:hypothetical protein
MGKLHYDGDVIDIDDRTLAHLQIVIVNRLRKKEGFLMSWLNSLAIGDGRGSIWLDHTIPLRFDFSGSRSPQINQAWLEALEKSAGSATGLLVTGEDGRLVRCGRAA